MPLERKGQKLIFLSIVFAMAISYPFLSLVNAKKHWMQIPILYLYLYVIWLAFIIGIAFIADRKYKK